MSSSRIRDRTLSVRRRTSKLGRRHLQDLACHSEGCRWQGDATRTEAPPPLMMMLLRSGDPASLLKHPLDIAAGTELGVAMETGLTSAALRPQAISSTSTSLR
ncbi:hypothetical protein AAFF_G00294410 [Aldrovandia affinis]|uniref:Uncharacterized protein n=1 Tax=Aldrovandia affinis TaxID=143900 RepID=A0AAD7R8Z2_9TELE|nr:hypothetical protein AAFF_G00294410 [Aldrovandia affinis]